MLFYTIRTNRYLQWVYSKYNEMIYHKKEPKLCLHLETLINSQVFSSYDIYRIREKTLNYVENMRLKNEPYGQYRYSDAVNKPVLYASACAALTRHLYGDLENLSQKERDEWVNYILTHQDNDGLFKDHLIKNYIAEKADWWGWRHLTIHVLMALTTLGSIAPKRFLLLDPFKDPQYAVKWLESRNWKQSSTSSDISNQIQNYIVLLQYARDFQGEKWAGKIIEKMLDWLDKAQDPKTGLWGNSFHTPLLLSLGVQFGYHIWLLYFYEGRPIKFAEQVIDSCLTIQNKLGGFGAYINSSACEDIDSIDPLVRLSSKMEYKKTDIESSLQKASRWVLINVNEDGGFVFRRNEALTCGHKLMYSEADQSNMFYTWFRTLSLAYLGKALPDSMVGKFPWQFIKCPGHQFWFNK